MQNMTGVTVKLPATAPMSAQVANISHRAAPATYAMSLYIDREQMNNIGHYRCGSIIERNKMLWHCGILDDEPEKNRAYQFLTRGYWPYADRWPTEVVKEAQIWLAMPGFSKSFHSHVLNRGRVSLEHQMGYYDRWKDEVAANWASATRDDCVRFARMRPGTGNIPIISQMRMLDDLKAGMPQQQVAQDYRVTQPTVAKLSRFGVQSRRGWPASVRLPG